MAKKKGYLVYAMYKNFKSYDDKEVFPPKILHGYLPVYRRKRDAERYAKKYAGCQIAKINFED